MRINFEKIRILLLSCVLCLGAFNSHAATTPSDPPTQGDDQPEVRFTADEMQHDRELDIITARGNVQVNYVDRILNANVVVYNKRQDLLSASGNVTLLEPDGEVIFGEFMELTGDLKTGIIQDIRAILSDSSLVASSGGRRTDHNRLDLRNAVYSPCRLCEEDPTRPPLWQVKAVKVVHDKNRQTVEYSDAWLEVAGVPILYTPYMSHPDPTVKRKSGFLTPTFGSSVNLGSTITAPYFLNIASNADATLTPIFTDKEGIVVHGEYRHNFHEGEFRAKGSITDATSSSESTFSTEEGTYGVRGHISAEGRFDYDETWRWGFDVNRSTDSTYLTKFGFSADNTLQTASNSLESNAFVEGFRGRNYIKAESSYFQDLQTTPRDNIPLILPLVDYNHVSEPDRYGGTKTFDANFLSMTRDVGKDIHRASLRGGWQLPHTSSSGHVTTVSTSLMGDGYFIQDGTTTTTDNTFTGRLFPQAALDWRYPLASGDDKIHQLIEPIASVVVSPYGGNPSNIPNEDSLNFEYDDANLFSSNRFSGIDRVEGGPRLNYGLRWGVFGRDGGNTSLLVGQTYRYKVDDTFGQGSGLDDNFSDIVGRLHVKPGNHLDMYYRTRLDKSSLDANRHEIDFLTGVPALKFSSRYIFFNRQEDSEFPGREEISMTLSSNINRIWRSTLSATKDLAADETRSMNLNLIYEDECFLFSTGLTRTFYHNQDLHPENAVLFRFVFKTLGEITPSVTVLNPNPATN